MRIGHGYDIHRLEVQTNKKNIRLGGVDVPSERSFIAHSDGDVVIHALIDALLGAAGLGDIGQHFPDTDPQYKGCCSRTLLVVVLDLLKGKKYIINNVDITIIAQKPKLSGYLASMREILSSDLNIPVNNINLKAKTNENCDALGRCEAIAAFAVVTIKNSY